MENLTNSFREMNLLLQLVEELKIKSKAVMSWSSWKQKEFIFLKTFILSERSFLNICFLSPWIVYWINCQNIYTFTYQKTLLHALLLLVFKIVRGLQRIHKVNFKFYDVTDWTTNNYNKHITQCLKK